MDKSLLAVQMEDRCDRKLLKSSMFLQDLVSASLKAFVKRLKVEERSIKPTALARSDLVQAELKYQSILPKKCFAVSQPYGLLKIIIVICRSIYAKPLTTPSIRSTYLSKWR